MNVEDDTDDGSSFNINCMAILRMLNSEEINIMGIWKYTYNKMQDINKGMLI